MFVLTIYIHSTLLHCSYHFFIPYIASRFTKLLDSNLNIVLYFLFFVYFLHRQVHDASSHQEARSQR